MPIIPPEKNKTMGFAQYIYEHPEKEAMRSTDWARIAVAEGLPYSHTALTTVRRCPQKYGHLVRVIPVGKSFLYESTKKERRGVLPDFQYVPSKEVEQSLKLLPKSINKNAFVDSAILQAIETKLMS